MINIYGLFQEESSYRMYIYISVFFRINSMSSKLTLYYSQSVNTVKTVYNLHFGWQIKQSIIFNEEKYKITRKWKVIQNISYSWIEIYRVLTDLSWDWSDWPNCPLSKVHHKQCFPTDCPLFLVGYFLSSHWLYTFL